MSLLMTHVTNTLTSKVTEFANYPFNSMVRFNGVYLGASEDGLFKLDDDASLEPITGTMTTGQMHFGSEMQKRMDNVFMGMRSDGDITVTVTVDENVIGTYTVSPETVETLKQRRGLVGKGAKGKYWQFQFECSDPFDYDTINLAAVVVTRRL